MAKFFVVIAIHSCACSHPGRRKGCQGCGQSSICREGCRLVTKQEGLDDGSRIVINDGRCAQRVQICISPPCSSYLGTADELAAWMSWYCSFHKGNLLLELTYNRYVIWCFA